MDWEEVEEEEDEGACLVRENCLAGALLSPPALKLPLWLGKSCVDGVAIVEEDTWTAVGSSPGDCCCFGLFWLEGASLDDGEVLELARELCWELDLLEDRLLFFFILDSLLVLVLLFRELEVILLSDWL